MNNVRMIIEFCSYLVFLWFACEELGEKRRRVWQPSAWIYNALMVGAMAGLLMLLGGYDTAQLAVWLFAVIAMHFVRKLWQSKQKRTALPPPDCIKSPADNLFATRDKVNPHETD